MESMIKFYLQHTILNIAYHYHQINNIPIYSIVFESHVVCVLTCPPAGEAVSNTKAYQSPLDVPPPPRNLTTRIKAKLWITP